MTAYAMTVAWLQLRAAGARNMADQERAEDGDEIVARACDDAADEAIRAMRVLLDVGADR